jgi:predicted aminopeptidase
VRLVAIALAFATGCWTGDYLAQQGVGELKLLRARRRVVDVLADPEVPPTTKERLRLAMAARQFGIDELGLRGGDSFTRFLELHGEPVAWNVTAAPKDKLEPHLRSFPIVGAIPYLGYFREADARAEADRLAKLGFDTYVRAVAGYSTLGITADPIYSSMIEGPPAHVVEVVLHEMLHGTIYLAGRSDWNESLATFVGLHGAAEFFARYAGAEAGRAVLAQAEERRQREAAFSRFLEPVLRALETLYAQPLSLDEKLRQREAIFTRAQAEYRARFPPKPGRATPAFLEQPLNNAVLLAFAIYHRATPEHERLFARVGRDLAAFVRLYRQAIDMNDPLGFLRRRATVPGGPCCVE